MTLDGFRGRAEGRVECIPEGGKYRDSGLLARLRSHRRRNDAARNNETRVRA